MGKENIAETLAIFGSLTLYRAGFSISKDHVHDDQFRQLVALRDDSLLDINPKQDREAALEVLKNLEKARKTFVRENAIPETAGSQKPHLHSVFYFD